MEQMSCLLLSYDDRMYEPCLAVLIAKLSSADLEIEILQVICFYFILWYCYVTNAICKQGQHVSKELNSEH